MILYHVSPSKNDTGIRRHGIRYTRRDGALPVVWLVTARDIDWAVRHVLERHETRDITIWSVLGENIDLRRAPHGRFFAVADIPTANVLGTIPLPSWVWPLGTRDRDWSMSLSLGLGVAACRLNGGQYRATI